jgi:hypothetical protein
MKTQHKTQFQSLVQNELTRLEGIVAHNESLYPIAFRSYRSVVEQSQPSSYYRFFSFVRMVQCIF